MCVLAYTNQRLPAPAVNAVAPAVLIKLVPVKVMSPPELTTLFATVRLPPACTVKLPVKLDAPLPKVIALASRKLTFLAPLILTVVKLFAALVASTSPAPLIRRLPGAVTVPVKVRTEAPDVVAILAPEMVVTEPDMPAAPVPVSAPLPPTPVPAILMLDSLNVTAFISTVAPLVTVVPPPATPSAFAFDAMIVPAFTAVAPAYVFAPLRVTVPTVVLVKAPAPPKIALTVPFCIAYEVPVSTPVVPVMLPLVSVTVPTVSLNAPISNVPPFTVNAPLESALFTPSTKVPALTVVKPV